MHLYNLSKFLLISLLLLQAGCSTLEEVINPTWTPEIISNNSAHYMPDFSYAGYQWGEKNIPDLQGKIFDVTQFGAMPDDYIDDTLSVLATLKSAHEYNGPVVIFFPPGRFILSETLPVKRSHIVIRGSGGHSKKNTTLYFPKPILEVRQIPEHIIKKKSYIIRENKRVNGRFYSPVSWTGGFIWTSSDGIKKNKLRTAVISGNQGGQTLAIEPTDNIKTGSVLQIRWCSSDCIDSDGLLSHTVNNQLVNIGSKTRKLVKKGLIRQTVTVEHIINNSITIKEKLLHDIHPDWGVTLSHTNFLNEVGIESLRIAFPDSYYQGHLMEAGYNALFLKNLLHGWVSDVLITNSDNGIIIQKSKNLTIENITLNGREGHHSIVISNSNNILTKDFHLLSKARHGPSMGYASRLNVYTNGEIYNSPLDQHNGLNQQNLFDDLQLQIYDIGQLFNHGGAKNLRPTSGAFSVFWNIEVDFKKNGLITLNDAPSARLIGLHGSLPIKLNYGPDAYIKGLNDSNIKQKSLYQYQLQKRLQ